MDSLLELFCDVDDFCQAFLPRWNQHLFASGQKQRQRARSLSISEVMAILITFHQSHSRDFIAYYLDQVLKSWRAEFPGLVSYTRFVEFIPSALVPLIVYLHTCCLVHCTGISFIDSTSLDVCLNQRIHNHKAFQGLAARGQTSMGWFFGFKLHLVVNDRGEILQFCITPGNVDDHKPVPGLAKKLFGKLFGDKGYLSQALAKTLREMFDLQLITKLRSNMQNQLRLMADRILLHRRAIIESIIDQLKNISQIEHSRHRSIPNFFVNVLCGLIAYCRKPTKPSLGLDDSLPLPA
jgi:Transposase DDE domain